MVRSFSVMCGAGLAHCEGSDLTYLGGTWAGVQLLGQCLPSTHLRREAPGPSTAYHSTSMPPHTHHPPTHPPTHTDRLWSSCISSLFDPPAPSLQTLGQLHLIPDAALGDVLWSLACLKTMRPDPEQAEPTAEQAAPSPSAAEQAAAQVAKDRQASVAATKEAVRAGIRQAAAELSSNSGSGSGLAEGSEARFQYTEELLRKMEAAGDRMVDNMAGQEVEEAAEDNRAAAEEEVAGGPSQQQQQQQMAPNQWWQEFFRVGATCLPACLPPTCHCAWYAPSSTSQSGGQESGGGRDVGTYAHMNAGHALPLAARQLHLSPPPAQEGHCA